MMTMAHRMPLLSRKLSIESLTKLLFAMFLAFAGVLGTLYTTDTTVGAQEEGVNTFGAEVVDFQPGYYGTTCTEPNNQGGTASSVLGPPDDPAGDGSGSAGPESTSLGFTGSVTIRFEGPCTG